MVILNQHGSVLNNFLAEMRDVEIQKDRMRFKTNLERIGALMAYEISKDLHHESRQIQTPLGIATEQVTSNRLVIATILRAGLPMHEGFLSMFDQAESAFVSASRRTHKDYSFEVDVTYASSPDLTNKTLIVVDPMIATGVSLVKSVKALLTYGEPSQIILAGVIGAEAGMLYIKEHLPLAKIYLAAYDAELTAKYYIVPGLGDAGDLAYGIKN